MWTNYSQEQLEQFAGFLDQELTRENLKPAYEDQLRYAAESVRAYLGQQAVDQSAVVVVSQEDVSMPEADAAESQLVQDEEPIPSEEKDESEANLLGKSSPRLEDTSSEKHDWRDILEKLSGPRPEAIVRFDPEMGAFTATGRMLADATASPVIKENMDLLISAASFLADKSQEGYSRLTTDELFQALGVANDNVEPLVRRYITREIRRLLTPTRQVSFMTDGASKQRITLHGAFRFVVTELTPGQTRRVKEGKNTPHEVLCHAVTWKEDATADTLTASLCNKRVPFPTNAQQAIELLDALMQGDVLYERLVTHLSDEESQAVLDLGHAFVQSAIGYRSYMLARNERTIRAGRPGFNGRARQVTGSQQGERFEPRGHAEPTQQ